MRKPKFWICLVLVVCLLYSCYSSRNTAEVSNNVRAAYIAPKGITFKNGKKASEYLSNGAFYADGTVRLGISSLYRDGKGKLTVKYLAEEQPDLGLELLRSIKANAALNGNKGDDSVSASAAFIDSVKTSLSQLTHKTSALNIARSILYRFNENAYNNVSDSTMARFVYKIIPGILATHDNELNHSADLKLKHMEVLLHLDNIVKTMKDNKIEEAEIQDFIKSVMAAN